MFKNKIKHQAFILKKGEFLFRQNTSAEHLFFLEKGRVKLVRETIDGQSLVVHIAYSQETFAEASFFSQEYHCHAICDSTCTVLSFAKTEVSQYLQNHPKSMMTLLKTYAQQVRSLRLLNEIKSINSAYERVLTFFISEANENFEFHFAYSLKDMAQRLGLAHETFYRTLKTLEQKNKITRKNQCIEIIN
jgi:CRP-like cAMP-binding protein